MIDLNCHSLKFNLHEIRCALPNKHNVTAITIKLNNLYSIIRSSDINTQGDIFNFISVLKNNMSFGDVIKYIHVLLGLKYEYIKKKQICNNFDPLDIFMKHKSKKYIVNNENQIFNETILSEYIPMLHKLWFNDGIMPFVTKIYAVGYDFKSKRITCGWRQWDGDKNDFVGITGRTTNELYKELDIPKYIALKPFKKTNNIFGLNENYMYIQQAGIVFVGESEKFVLQRASRKDFTGVGIGGHELSYIQTKILISLDTDICLCYDEGVSLECIKKECEKFYGIRNIYYIFDTWGMLKSKESPSDKHNKIYQFLINNKIKYERM